MEIQIRFRRRMSGVKSREIRRKLTRVLNDLGYDKGELSVLFTSDRHIAELNSRFLGRQGPTNVLAFPMWGGLPPAADPGMLGDIVVSLDAAAREAEMTGESPVQAVDRLLVHGLLHLLGYDHETSLAEARRMQRKEKRLLGVIRED